MSDLAVFTLHDRPLRSVLVNGDPWFLAGDVCAHLDLANVGQAIAGLDEDERGSITIADGTPGNPNRAIVSEAGLYALALRSRKPEAATFRRWVTHEVLPSIRKTGGYGQTMPTGPELLARAVLEAAETIKALEATAEGQRARLQLVEPKALAFDRWLSTNGSYAVEAVGKALAAAGAPDMGRNRLHKWMLDNEWTYRSGSNICPMQVQVERKRLVTRLGQYENSKTGAIVSTTTVRITAKGAARLAALMGVLPESVAEALGEEVAAA